ncbi:hypothetical protein GACE_2295 [Geoglobus acetivorans]|uniref:Uncharacterized protein n=1 Tax=Geoglobus acetivorans TaxID=565033 RepID=A0A0A7GGK4_GEOAI|nr:hypothetical protein GACE_2295 [Geoglobus acetivorans]
MKRRANAIEMRTQMKNAALSGMLGFATLTRNDVATKAEIKNDATISVE